MLQTQHLRHLTLAQGTSSGRAPHVATASGLVAKGDQLYVVADDELFLGVFPRHGVGHGELVRLFSGELPVEHAARKARKPDLEALCLLPAFGDFPHGALLALGSGSTKDRFRAALLGLDAEGKPTGKPIGMIPQALYLQLEERLGALNLEGAAVSGDSLVLLQRGNGKGGQDATVRVSLRKVLDGFRDKKPTAAGAVEEVRLQSLGELSGVRLSFTDASPLPDGRIVFAAAAEASADTYQDGPCEGSAVGVLSPSLELLSLTPLARKVKVEGLHAELDGSLLMVADADDAALASPLLGATLPL